MVISIIFSLSQLSTTRLASGRHQCDAKDRGDSVTQGTTELTVNRSHCHHCPTASSPPREHELQGSLEASTRAGVTVGSAWLMSTHGCSWEELVHLTSPLPLARSPGEGARAARTGSAHHPLSTTLSTCAHSHPFQKAFSLQGLATLIALCAHASSHPLSQLWP